VAVTIAGLLITQGFIPGFFCDGKDLVLYNKGILVLGAGSIITAIEVFPS
jgi:hypothetical protein